MHAHDSSLTELNTQLGRATANFTTSCRNRDFWDHRRKHYQSELAAATTIPMTLRAYQREYEALEKIEFWAREGTRALRGFKRVKRAVQKKLLEMEIEAFEASL